MSETSHYVVPGGDQKELEYLFTAFVHVHVEIQRELVRTKRLSKTLWEEHLDLKERIDAIVESYP